MGTKLRKHPNGRVAFWVQPFSLQTAKDEN